MTLTAVPGVVRTHVPPPQGAAVHSVCPRGSPFVVLAVVNVASRLFCEREHAENRTEVAHETAQPLTLVASRALARRAADGPASVRFTGIEVPKPVTLTLRAVRPMVRGCGSCDGPNGRPADKCRWIV